MVLTLIGGRVFSNRVPLIWEAILWAATCGSDSRMQVAARCTWAAVMERNARPPRREHSEARTSLAGGGQGDWEGGGQDDADSPGEAVPTGGSAGPIQEAIDTRWGSGLSGSLLRGFGIHHLDPPDVPLAQAGGSPTQSTRGDAEIRVLRIFLVRQGR